MNAKKYRKERKPMPLEKKAMAIVIEVDPRRTKAVHVWRTSSQLRGNSNLLHKVELELEGASNLRSLLHSQNASFKGMKTHKKE